MVDGFKKFVRAFTVFSVAILLLSLAIYLWVPQLPISPAYPYVVLFFYRILNKARQNRISKFANAYMLVNFGKLILFILIILVYAYLNRSDAVSFIITFFVYYVLFTTFEIYSLLK